RPIVVMVVALDDWTSSVTTAPQNAPDSGVAAALLRTVRSPEPASALRPFVITVMPSRKRPTPPRIEIAVDMSRFAPCACVNDQVWSIRPAPNGSRAWGGMSGENPLPLFFACKRFPRRRQLFFLRRVDFGIFQAELLHHFHDRSCNNEPREPLVVGWHDVPR